MGERSDIITALSKMTTGSLLALILGFQIWINSENDKQWNDRLGRLIERQTESQERQERTTQRLSESLIRILDRVVD